MSSIDFLPFRIGLGESAGLLAAMVWSLSSLLWVRVSLTAVGINAIKNLVGSAFLLVHLLALTLWYQRPLLEGSLASVGWLVLSGLVGIVIGDTFFFNSLQMLQPRRALMVASTSPVFAVLLMVLLQGQIFSSAAAFGILLVIGGVWMVIADRPAPRRIRDGSADSISGDGHSAEIPAANSVGVADPVRRVAGGSMTVRDANPAVVPFKGVLMGLAAALCQACGGLLSQAGMTDCSPIEAAFIRISASSILLTAWFRYRGVLRRQLREATQRGNLRLIIPATAMGTWIGIWLSQVAFKWTTLATAQTLLSTSPLFATLWASVFLGQYVGRLGVIGAVVGIAGVWFVVQF